MKLLLLFLTLSAQAGPLTSLYYQHQLAELQDKELVAVDASDDLRLELRKVQMTLASTGALAGGVLSEHEVLEIRHQENQLKLRLEENAAYLKALAGEKKIAEIYLEFAEVEQAPLASLRCAYHELWQARTAHFEAMRKNHESDFEFKKRRYETLLALQGTGTTSRAVREAEFEMISAGSRRDLALKRRDCADLVFNEGPGHDQSLSGINDRTKKRAVRGALHIHAVAIVLTHHELGVARRILPALSASTRIF